MEDLAAYQDFSLKARCADVPALQRALAGLQVEFVGTDHQRDTYYATERGKLKLRESTREPLLIEYERLPDAQGAEKTRVTRYDRRPSAAHVAAVLAGRQMLGVVEKTRDIYRKGLLTVHLDRFANGDYFVEIEAIDCESRQTPEELQRQCLAMAAALGITPADVISNGYLPG